jgi:hypothetical protein
MKSAIAGVLVAALATLAATIWLYNRTPTVRATGTTSPSCSVFNRGTAEMVTVIGAAAPAICFFMISNWTPSTIWTLIGQRTPGDGLVCRVSNGGLEFDVYDGGDQRYGQQTCHTLRAAGMITTR